MIRHGIFVVSKTRVKRPDIEPSVFIVAVMIHFNPLAMCKILFNTYTTHRYLWLHFYSTMDAKYAIALARRIYFWTCCNQLVVDQVKRRWSLYTSTQAPWRYRNGRSFWAANSGDSCSLSVAEYLVLAGLGFLDAWAMISPFCMGKSYHYTCPARVRILSCCNVTILLAKWFVNLLHASPSWSSSILSPFSSSKVAVRRED